MPSKIKLHEYIRGGVLIFLIVKLQSYNAVEFVNK